MFGGESHDTLCDHRGRSRSAVLCKRLAQHSERSGYIAMKRSPPRCCAPRLTPHWSCRGSAPTPTPTRRLHRSTRPCFPMMWVTAGWERRSRCRAAVRSFRLRRTTQRHTLLTVRTCPATSAAGADFRAIIIIRGFRGFHGWFLGFCANRLKSLSFLSRPPAHPYQNGAGVPGFRMASGGAPGVRGRLAEMLHPDRFVATVALPSGEL